MSLKMFHLLFIAAATALCIGVGIGEVRQFASADGSRSDLMFGLGALAAGAGLILYERYFLKKTRNLSWI